MGFQQWVVGVSIGVFSKVVASLGLVLQKRWHARNEKEPADRRKSWYTDPWWMAGFATYAGGNLITIAALAMIPQTVVASLDSLVLVFNALWAPLLLGEHPGRSDWLWNGVIICGVALVVVFGPSMSQEHTGREMLALLVRPAYVVFAATAVGIYVACVMYRAKHTRPEVRRRTSRCASSSSLQQHPPSVARGVSIESCKERIGGASPESAQSHQAPRDGDPPPLQRTPSIIVDVSDPAGALAAGLAPAVLSCFCLQLSKVLGELIADTVRGRNQFDDWPVYLFIIALAVVNAQQVKNLQAALNEFSTLVIVPIFQVTLTILAVVGGGIYFREFELWTDPAEASMAPSSSKAAPLIFSVGLILAVTGVLFLSLRGTDIPDKMWSALVNCCREPTPATRYPSSMQGPPPKDLALINYSMTRVPWCEVNASMADQDLVGLDIVSVNITHDDERGDDEAPLR
eukprot:TRINITY_DN15041_c0_g1_i1.p1 TRINITY_DN15041_c0_g1~~TRINITY_DN15041_c0_g1_i1.p1  ORF type:complete len:459 (+),score=88.17 TRINITY_DN15041_c0_g1_i1:49-1425(+)